MTIGHTDALLTATDRVVCRVIEGVPIDPAARERLICAREAIERMLDGRIAEGTRHDVLWAEINRVGWEKTYGKTA